MNEHIYISISKSQLRKTHHIPINEKVFAYPPHQTLDRAVVDVIARGTAVCRPAFEFLQTERRRSGKTAL